MNSQKLFSDLKASLCVGEGKVRLIKSHVMSVQNIPDVSI